MSLSVDPKFKKWFEKRKVAQKLKIEIPTRNTNPTNVAGKGVAKSSKTKAKFNTQKRGKG